VKKVFVKGEPPKYPNPPKWWKFGKLFWYIFGNSDDPEPPINYLPNKPFWLRTLLWYLRNPLHNFTFYVIGCKHKDRIVHGKEPSKVFVEQGWNWYIGRPVDSKWRWLPFISYQRKIGRKTFQFYIGFRLGTCFGFKFRIH